MDTCVHASAWIWLEAAAAHAYVKTESCAQDLQTYNEGLGGKHMYHSCNVIASFV